MNSSYIFGRNSVIEYLKTEHSINKAYIVKEIKGGSISLIITKLKDRKVEINYVEKSKLDFMVENANHQGVVISVPPFDYSEIDDIIEKARIKNEDPFIVILDGIQDPHNLGAIIRTSNVLGAHGIIIRKKRAADITPLINKISAGALNHMPIVRVTNLNDTVKLLKSMGIWIYAADMDGEPVYSCNMTGPIAIVIGNEGDGISRLLKKNSDFVVKIPLMGEINSLNASVSAAIISYEIQRQRSIKNG